MAIFQYNIIYFFLYGIFEKGLYMLATILKSPKATETTLAIIDTFTKVREISRTIKTLPQTHRTHPSTKSLCKEQEI